MLTDPMTHEYEESFVGFIDFLGFSEASRDIDDAMRRKILALLTALVDLRSDFSAAAQQNIDGSTSYLVKPAISTFSDHIVISVGLDSLRKAANTDDDGVLSFLTLPAFQNLVTVVAAQALRLGFLIRGAATIGKLYHAKGVVFGEALVEAASLEAMTAIYPRIIASPSLSRRLKWGSPHLTKDSDGIFFIDYIQHMTFRSSAPGDDWNTNVRNWFIDAVAVIQSALKDHESNGRLKELAKWTWFAKRFRQAALTWGPEAHKAIGISLDAITWD